MNTLPKYIYLFQCLPTNVPKSFFKELNKLITSFIWQKKNPRVKLSSLQAPYSRGGLNLPNFRNYYLASQYRSIWIWLHAERSEARWVPIEQHEVNPIPLKDVPFLGTKKCLSKLTNNLLILNNLTLIEEFWRRTIEIISRVMGIQIELDPKLWILGDTGSINVNYHKKYFILLASTAVKKCILLHWKSENSPTLKHWINELVSYCTAEKISYSAKGKYGTFEKIWGPFLAVLPSLDLTDHRGDANPPGSALS
uniref:Reverse transcriptase domain-containing protein n=1 Tax=Oreochromis aureus TaxID=47969 RepID=A0A668UC86_OREAU